jgi:hypothetical protein
VVGGGVGGRIEHETDANGVVVLVRVETRGDALEQRPQRRRRCLGGRDTKQRNARRERAKLRQLVRVAHRFNQGTDDLPHKGLERRRVALATRVLATRAVSR